MTDKHRRPITACALGAQAMATVPATILSVATVAIARDFELDLGRVGVLFLAINGGGSLAFVLAGPLCDRIGRGKVLRSAAAICLGGLLISATAPTLVVLSLGAFLAGLGGGSAALAGIVLVNDLHPERRRTMITGSHLVASLGSVTGPVLAGSLIRLSGSWRLPYEVCAAGVLAFLVLLVALRFPATGRRPEATGSDRPMLKSGRIRLLGLAYLLHCGAEVSISSWLCIYLASRFQVGPLLAGLGLTVYELGMILGRVILSGLPKRYGDVRVLRFCALGAAVFAGLVILSPNYSASLVLFALLGLFISGDSPAILTYTGRHFPERSGMAFGLILTIGSLGSAAVPPVLGPVAQKAGLYAILAGPSVLLVALFWVAVVLEGYHARSDTS